MKLQNVSNKKPVNIKFTGFCLDSRGSKNRTRVDGFGDRCSTAELCPSNQFSLQFM